MKAAASLAICLRFPSVFVLLLSFCLSFFPTAFSRVLVLVVLVHPLLASRALLLRKVPEAMAATLAPCMVASNAAVLRGSTVAAPDSRCTTVSCSPFSFIATALGSGFMGLFLVRVLDDDLDVFFWWGFRSGCWVGVGFVGISFTFVGFGRQAMWGASSSRVWGDSLGQSRCTGKAQQKFVRGKGTDLLKCQEKVCRY